MLRKQWFRLGVALLPLCATPVWAENPDTGPGCGLGKFVWSDYSKQKSIAPQVMMATTNGTFGSQTFGISSGTSGCTNDGTIMAEHKVTVFAAANYDTLSQEMAGASFHPLSLFVLLGWLCLSLFTGVAKAQTDKSAYFRELIQRASAAALHEQRYWHLLLHYRRTMAGGYESEADEEGFFLAPNGRTDPKAELNATLAQFFSTQPVGRSRQPARCAFIARYHWLKVALDIDESGLPSQPCERFQSWLAELNPASITLIFPSAYMNNPSSMFG